MEDHPDTFSSQAHRGRNIKSQSITSLLKVVTSLNSFLRRADGGGMPAGGAPITGDPGGGPLASKAPVSSVSAKVPAGNKAGDKGESSQIHLSVLMADKISWPSRRPFLATFIELTTISRSGSLKRKAASLASAGGSAADRGAGGAPLSKKALHDLERGVAKPKGKWSVSGKVPGPSTIAKAAAAIAAAASATGSQVEPTVDEGPVMTAATVSDVSGLTRRLIALLFDCWAECGPSKVVGGGAGASAGSAGGGSGKALELESLQVLSGILSSAFALLNRLLMSNREDKEDADKDQDSQVGSELETLSWASELVIRRVSPHFPATVPSVKPAPVVAEALVQYNLQVSRREMRLVDTVGQYYCFCLLS